MAREAVITGIGVVSPAGMGVHDFWDGILTAQSFLAPITRFDTTRFAGKMGGMVEPFEAKKFLDPRLVVQTDRWTHFDLICAQQAIADAQLELNAEDPTRVAAVFAAGKGGNEFGQQQLHVCWGKGTAYVSAYLSIGWFYAASIGQVSIRNGIRGLGRNICADAAGGLIALGYAAKIIAQGICDVVIVGGSEASIAPYAFACHHASGQLSPETAECSFRPAYPYRPFDATRTGTVVGEGGAVFCVESKEHARQRGARVYAEIAGWGQSFDGAYLREPAPDGHEYARALSMALETAQITPEDVDWIICDGLGTQAGDVAEVRALREAFGTALDQIPASAPKSMIGRLFNGGSTVDVAMAVLGLANETILPTVGYNQPDPRCPIDVVPNEVRPCTVLEHVVVGARGTGGFNAALVVRKSA